MSKQTIEDAVHNGVRQGRAEAAWATEAAKRDLRTQRENLAAAFNAASEVIHGLTFLETIPGSRFHFAVEEGVDRVYISTNIPAPTGHDEGDMGALGITVRADETSACGGTYRKKPYSDSITVRNNEAGSFEKVIDFVAKRAVGAGLVP